jgi:thiol-disulfide isomerase/thioredoxin
VLTTRSAPLLVLAALAMVACGATTPTGRSGGEPVVLSKGQVEAQTRGHPTVLLFTAQGCASCEAEARALQDAARGRSDIRLVGVDMTGDDSAQALATYVQAIGLPPGGFVWTIDGDSALTRRYGITSLSSTVFLDSSGQPRFVNQGPVDAGTYAQELSELR